MTQSLDGEVVVSVREYGKMVYLLSALAQMDKMYQDFKSWRNTAAFSSGVSVNARIDWRSVAIHCAPQVLVVLTHDKTGNEFEDFPLYAVLPETRQYIRLDGPVVLTIEKSDDAEAEVDVQGALNSLFTYVETIDGGKKENAMRQLQVLKRILR